MQVSLVRRNVLRKARQRYVVHELLEAGQQRALQRSPVTLTPVVILNPTLRETLHLQHVTKLLQYPNKLSGDAVYSQGESFQTNLFPLLFCFRVRQNSKALN